MFRNLCVLSLCMTLVACSKPVEPKVGAASPPAAAAHAVAWVKPEAAHIDPIFAQAKASNKPVLLYWGAVWCPPCNQVKATVFNRQDFIDRSQLFVPVYLDGDSAGAQQLGARFKVRGYPTMILFRPDGTELTRLPGEVEAARYMEMLDLGLTSGTSAKEALARALGREAASLPAQAWRQLAYYSWDQDEAQLVNAKERSATLHQLALAAGSAHPQAAARLALKAVVAAKQDQQAVIDPAVASTRLLQVLQDPVLRRESFDVLVNYAADLVQALSPSGSAERLSLVVAYNASLDQFAVDASLSQSDRLSAVYAKVQLAKLELGKNTKVALSGDLLQQVRQAVATANANTRTSYERQAVIPNAADLLSEAGLVDESDVLLKAELPQALSPYYHMLVLSGNAKTRGDKPGALVWAEKAWQASEGSATRLQWGAGYVGKLIDMAPTDAARIEKAAQAVLAELPPTPESFYERNRRGLEKMGQRLQAWAGTGANARVVQRLGQQLEAVCKQLPPQDETRAACAGVFKLRPT